MHFVETVKIWYLRFGMWACEQNPLSMRYWLNTVLTKSAEKSTCYPSFTDKRSTASSRDGTTAPALEMSKYSFDLMSASKVELSLETRVDATTTVLRA